jgi:hypothetical protein
MPLLGGFGEVMVAFMDMVVLGSMGGSLGGSMGPNKAVTDVIVGWGSVTAGEFGL